MPYKSAKQRGYLHVHEPALAARWDRKYGGKLAGKLAQAAPARKRKRHKR
jgi:hypothetical protein